MISHHLKVHGQYILMKFQTRMAYRLSFIMSILAAITWQLTGPAFIGVVYYSGLSFPGWTFQQVLLLQGILAIIRGISFMTFMGLLWNTVRLVRNGTMDIVLIRPLRTLWVLVMSAFDEEDIGQVFGGLVITITSLVLFKSDLGSIPLFLLLAGMGVLFFFSLALICCALTIYFVHTWRLYEFIDIIMIFAGYPKTIYSGPASLVFTIVIPLLITSFYPASALLGMDLEGALLAVISTSLLLIVTLFLYRKALKHYTSSGG